MESPINKSAPPLLFDQEYVGFWVSSFSQNHRAHVASVRSFFVIGQNFGQICSGKSVFCHGCCRFSETPYPDNMELVFIYSAFVKGDQHTSILSRRVAWME
ncbi:unnamed protein product [Thlaspi arvense]|uniref:Uncharacterized protein n=1 Tax=Thlaspi arvense TaxID=13288 RepID=A0AAU9RHB2_THLAR|nr:unnamed protein product [Thlaspi arvense]